MKEIAMQNATNSFNELRNYIESTEFLGWDPFDGLNSKFFFRFSFLKKNPTARLIWLQSFKRNPVNLRKVTGISKGYNSKGLGLLLTGYCNLYKIEKKPECIKYIKLLADKLLELKSTGYSGNCWGYNFDWQAKAFYQPKGTPSVVVTTFVGNALLNAYECTNDNKYLESAITIKDFILKDLNRTYDKEGNFSFSYSTVDSTQVFNASLLGAQMLSRICSYTLEPELINEARKAVCFAVNYQKDDGSWTYGTLPHHQWIDNFHTGYNLECIADYMRFSHDNSFQPVLDKGFRYYIETFFCTNGMSKYYSNKIYPIDVHNPAQLLVTLFKLNKFDEYKDIAELTLNWTIKNMQSPKGYFFYKKYSLFTNKIPYLRWTQAWMFYGMSYFFLYKKKCENEKTKIASILFSSSTS